MDDGDIWRPQRLATKTLVDATDVRAALKEALGKQPVQASKSAIIGAAAHLDAAAWILLRRLASARIGDLDQIENDLAAITKHAEGIIAKVKVDLTGLDDVGDVHRLTDHNGNLAPLVRVTGVNAPPTPLVSALEGGAQAAGFERPSQALDDALMHLANLHLWARAAEKSFKAGRGIPRGAELNKMKMRETRGSSAGTAHSWERDSPDDVSAMAPSHSFSSTHAHTGVDLGLSIIGIYSALSGRKIAISRTASTKSRHGGAVTGPLVRFVQTIFSGVRMRLQTEATLSRFSRADAFNPRGATVGNWVRKSKSSLNSRRP